MKRQSKSKVMKNQSHPQLSCHYDKLTCWLTCSLAGWLASWLAGLACWPKLGAAKETEGCDGWAHPLDEGSGVLRDPGGQEENKEKSIKMKRAPTKINEKSMKRH